MGEKASVFQTTQIGLQTTPGTAAAANKKLIAVNIIPSVSLESDPFVAAGNKYASFVTVNKEWTAVDISGKVTYNELLYLLSSLLSQPTPAQQGSTTAYKWTFVSDTDGEDAGKLFTVEQGDANSAWRCLDMRVSGLEFTFNRNEVSVSGTGLGGALEPGITLTASPTVLPAKPVLPKHLKVYLADTQAGLASATAMTRGFSLIWALREKVQQAWPIGQDPVIVEKGPTLESRLKVATDTVGIGLISTMRAGDTKWLRLKAEGGTIAGTYKYLFQIDFPAQISNMSKFEDNEGIYAVEYTMTGIDDSTWGKSFQIDVICDLQTL